MEDVLHVQFCRFAGATFTTVGALLLTRIGKAFEVDIGSGISCLAIALFLLALGFMSLDTTPTFGRQ